MTAECTRTKLRFQGLDGRDVVGRFDGGEITSDAGGVLLREVEQRTRILGRAERVLHRLSRPGSSRTPGGGVDQTAGAGAVPGLRGPQRPRRVVPGPAPGAVVRPGRPDGGVPARGVGSRQTAGRQEHPEPAGADSRWRDRRARTRRSWPTRRGWTSCCWRCLWKRIRSPRRR